MEHRVVIYHLDFSAMDTFIWHWHWLSGQCQSFPLPTMRIKCPHKHNIIMFQDRPHTSVAGHLKKPVIQAQTASTPAAPAVPVAVDGSTLVYKARCKLILNLNEWYMLSCTSKTLLVSKPHLGHKLSLHPIYEALLNLFNKNFNFPFFISMGRLAPNRKSPNDVNRKKLSRRFCRPISAYPWRWSGCETQRLFATFVIAGILLNFTETWGDPYYLGLTGLEVVAKSGDAIPLRLSMLEAVPRDLHVLNGYENDDRTLDK